MIKMTLSQPEIKMKIAPAKVVYTGGSKPYEGVYDVTPKTYEPVSCRPETGFCPAT